jgi:UDP-N-acetylmuramoyl-L-alanyl-D-glutamate--2,6-diaminopimelate ligase
LRKKAMLVPTIYPVTCHTDHVGPGSTFVAIKGFRNDGTTYIQQALEKGATTIIIEQTAVTEEIEKLCRNIKAKLCIVADARKALAEYSSAALDHPWRKLTIIGITGTKGKTTTTYIVEHILRHAGHTTAVLGTIANKIGDQIEASSNTTPESDYLHMFFAECLKRGVTHIVMEVSSHALSLHRVHGIEFDSVSFTNLAPEHMDFYTGMDDYFAAKAHIFTQIKHHGTCVINTDDIWGKRAHILATEAAIKTQARIISMGKLVPEQRLNNLPDNHIPFMINKSSFAGLALSLCLPQPFELVCPTLFGIFNCYNLSMAALLCLNAGISSSLIIEALATFPGVPGRLQRHLLANGAYAFVDYAHNPSSFHEALNTLRPYTTDLIVIFGCGGNRDRTKRPVMGQIAATMGDKVIVTDDNPRFEDRHAIINEIVAGIPQDLQHKILIEPNRKSAIAQAAALSRKGSIIALLGKGHETYYSVCGKTLHFDDFEEIKNF